MRGWGSLAFAALVAALVIFVVVSNSDRVTVVLPFVKQMMPLWGALVTSATFGAAAAALVLIWPMVRLKVQSRRQSKRIAELEQEIHGLRTLPIAGDAAGASSAPKV
jgi:uncharacterized integral membrane protein